MASLQAARHGIVVPTLRPYQRALVAAANDGLQTMQKVLAVSPTATGKTVCMLQLAKLAVARAHRVLIVVPAHLVGQTAKRSREWGLRTDTEQAAHRAEPMVDVVVASIDTLSNEKRLQRWDQEHFGLVIVDEAHHAVADTWQLVINYFELAKVVGLTATPDRTDCVSLLEVFEDVVFEYNIRDAIDDGWLTPVRQEFVHVDGLDFTRVQRDAQDLNVNDLEVLLNNADMIRHMAEPTVELMRGRQTVVFCVTVAHAHAYADYLRELGCHAAALDGTTPKTDRKLIEADFEAGRLQYLCNMGCLIEGWDCPPVSGIVMARKTTSRALYAQVLGRGLRLYPGKKDCLVLDFVGNHEHSLVHAVNALYPDIDDDQADRAAELQMNNAGLSIDDAMDLAADEERAKNASDATQLALGGVPLDGAGALLRKELAKNTRANATYRTTTVDPFSGSDASQIFELFELPRISDKWGDRRPTDKQVEALRRFGVKDPEVMSRPEASALMNRLVARGQNKRATLRQVRTLVRAGTHPDNARALSFEKATQGIDELKDNGWKRPDSWGPRQTEPIPRLRGDE